MKILAVASDITQTLAEIRLGIPLRALAQEQGWPLRLKSSFQCTRADWRWADVVILQRLLGPAQHQRLLWLKAQGVPVIYEIDDLLIEPAGHLLGSEELQRSADDIRDMLRHATCISTTTSRLAQRLSVFGPPVHLVPNYSPGADLPRASHDDTRPVTILVAASDLQQVRSLAVALKQLTATPTSPLTVVAIGPIADCLQEQGVALQRLPLLQRDEFLHTIAALPNPIGALPLDDSAFSSCKTAVKYFDYACAGIPCVCANVAPYADVVTPGRTGLLCDDEPAAWYAALSGLIASAHQRQMLSDAARACVVSEHALANTVAAYRTMLLDIYQLRVQPSVLRVMLDWLIDRLEQWAMPLRKFNRRRLNRRRRCP